ncbi:CarD family transcriptional regulator [Candidatus Bandiella woodruffii]|uniref:CarD family transcriptional regulator n=2 Tax=Candidatus Bandiella euplotis TaxID=1664265 RepID=A0ABZ0UM32_9RICK|nr:CarD family transcriptional regulator [Candidatus Bandiella woodruffii]
MPKQLNFQVGDDVVYPTHGVGKITAEEEEKYGGIEVVVYVISFDNTSMTLRVPKSRANKVGLRHLNSNEFLDRALDILSGNEIKLHKGMWSKRVQQYENKINSGDIIAIAEVIKELHVNIEKSERSYSEKVIYNDALERLAGEYAATHKLELNEAINKLRAKLNYH